MQVVAGAAPGGPDMNDLIGQAVHDREVKGDRTMKARFYVDVEFDGGKTDAESIATALDKVLANGLATLLDAWDEYGGEPKVGEFFVTGHRDGTAARRR